MSDRIPNFNPGPAALPRPVLERAQRELLDFGGTGMSLLEHSHRGPTYEAVHDGAMARVRRLLELGDDWEVLFLTGGARQQFAMAPMNLSTGGSADYVLTGHWSKLALAEAKRIGEARSAWGDPTEQHFERIPTPDELDLDEAAAFVHVTTNNTLFGTQWDDLPKTPAPLVCDMTSDVMSRRRDLSNVGLLYASAQKNLGAAGVTLVAARKPLIDAAPDTLPAIFRYATHAAKRSLYQTPPVYAIYLLGLTLEWLEQQGGVDAVEAKNRAQAAKVYAALDAHPDVYRVPVQGEDRSIMNMVFHVADEAKTKAFLDGAADRRMSGLKGHRTVGGLRASVYNAAEDAWVDALVAYLHDFATG